MFILCTDVYLNICIYTSVFYGFFELLQKEDFFLCKSNFVSIMRVKGSLLLKKNIDYHSDD